jgi:hypothetical protein
MHRPRSRRLWRLLASALLCVPFAGCEITILTVQIPDFDQVDGIWLWRLSDATGQFERSGLIQFMPLAADPQGGEALGYRESCANGVAGITNQAALSRSASAPSTATVSLHYLSCQGPGGTYRATAYNSAGESALSYTAVTF